MRNNLEHVLRSTLRARADLVTEESSNLPPDVPRTSTTPKWQVAAAAAAVVVVAAGLTVLVTTTDLGSNRQSPDEAPALAITSTEPQSGQQSRSEVECRKQDNRCTLQSVEVDGEILYLSGAETEQAGRELYTLWELYESDGYPLAAGGRPNQGGGFVRAMGAHEYIFVHPESLKCIEAGQGAPARCLLDAYDADENNEVFGMSKTDSNWFFDTRFSIPFQKETFRLGRIDGQDLVIAVQHDPQLTEKPNWSAGVWRWDGEFLGCSTPVIRKEDLPHWPQVQPSLDALDREHCFS